MTIKRQNTLSNRRRTRHKTITQSGDLSSQHIKLLKYYWKSICKNKSDQSIPDTQELTDSDLSHIRQNPMYSHIPDKIRHHFESSSQHGITYTTTLKIGRTVSIYITSPQRTNLDKKKTQIYLNNIIAWLNFISDFASSQCSQKLNIYLLLNAAKKRIPETDEEPMDTINANTAFTTSCAAVNYIFIFRREEWFKVLMHETFHCFGLDFSSFSTEVDKSNKRILSIFQAVHPDTDVRLYETYCEMWAEIFYFMFCVFTRRTGECDRFRESRFLQIWREEKLFSIYQSNKILHRSGFKYSDIFAVSSRKTQYTENTQALSYYVLKSMILWNLDKFLKWCIKYNDPHIQFDPSRVTEYCEFIEELVKTNKQYRAISSQHLIPKSKRDFDITQTMRMTANDPGWTQ